MVTGSEGVWVLAWKVARHSPVVGLERGWLRRGCIGELESRQKETTGEGFGGEERLRMWSFMI